MSNNLSFDELGNVDGVTRESARAFWTLDLKDEDCVREWIVENYDALRQGDLPRIQNMLANMAAYRGITYKVPQAGSRTLDIEPLAKAPKVGVNMIYDAVEQEVSKMTVYRPVVNCTPVSSEYNDVTAARIGDDLIEWSFNRAVAERTIENMERHKKVLGESFALCRWDEFRGPMDEDWLDAKKKHGRVPLLGADGQQVLGVDGDPLFVDRPMRQGDFYHQIFYSWQIQFQRRTNYSDSEWAVLCELEDVDTLKSLYPKIADKIKACAVESMVVDAENYDSSDYGHKAEVFTLFHRPTNNVGLGKLVLCTRDVVLEMGDMPEEWRVEDEGGQSRFPFVRMTDVDPPGCVRGYSSLDFARQLNSLYSNFTTMMARAIFQSAYPKWYMPRGTAKLESLANGETVVQYKGNVPPQMAAPNPVSPALWQGRESLKTDFQMVMSSSGVSRGAPPPGVKAWHAIQYLDELENERRNVAVVKHNQAITELAKADLRMMAVKYDSKRIERVIGRNNAGSLKGFDPKELASIYSVGVQVASGLSRQKSMRVAQVIDLKTTFPALIPDEEVVNMMGIGDDKSMRTGLTVSVRMADYENDQFLRSKTVKSPEVWENHLIHYGIHKRLMEDRTFNDTMSTDAQQAMKDHVEATEMVMLGVASKNPQYLMMVMSRFPDFPIFCDPVAFGYASPMAMLQGGMPQPAAPESAAVEPGQMIQPQGVQTASQAGPSLSVSAANPMADNAGIV